MYSSGGAEVKAVLSRAELCADDPPKVISQPTL